MGSDYICCADLQLFSFDTLCFREPGVCLVPFAIYLILLWKHT